MRFLWPQHAKVNEIQQQMLYNVTENTYMRAEMFK